MDMVGIYLYNDIIFNETHRPPSPKTWDQNNPPFHHIGSMSELQQHLELEKFVGGRVAQEHI